MVGRGIVAMLVMSALSASCAVDAPKPRTPALPAVFENQPPATQSTVNQPLNQSRVAAPWPSQDWYSGFASAELNALLAQASSHNLDLSIAAARVAQADARARQARAARLPAVDAAGKANFLAGHSRNGSAHETDWSALLTASYEFDFWGKNRAAANSASFLATASRADRDTVALTTLAGVANGYFQVLSFRERLATAEANVDAARSLLAVIQARFDVGLSNPVELAAQKATLATAALVIPDLQQREAEALTALAQLLGREPEGFVVTAKSLDSVSEPQVDAGLPIELLTRRPDLYMAEANMQAAHADLVVARAALLPSLSLTASGGVQSPALQAAVLTLAGVGPSLNLGASLLQPIFDGGKLRARRAEVQARDEELVTAYRAAILSALVDVENSLGALRHLDAARRDEQESVTQSERAFDGARIRYKEGSGDYLTVLEAQRSLYSARDQFSQYKLARLQALVALAKALGGGWQARDAQLAPHTPVAPINSLRDTVR